MLTNIFNGVEILFFSLGVLTTFAVILLYQLYKMYKMNWKSWTLVVLSEFLILFSIAWSFSAILEGEPRSASMGLVLFGISGLIIGALANRIIKKKEA